MIHFLLMIPVLHYNIKLNSVESNKIQVNQIRSYKQFTISDHEFLIKKI